MTALTAFTIFHVLISLVGIAAGFVVMFGMIGSRRLNGWTSLFLWTTLATTLTGFMFPFHGLLPSYYVGFVSTLILVIAIVARYPKHMNGSWRWIYVVTAILGQYLNVFVLVVQLFLKVPALHALAPKGNEPPFLISQVVVMLLFIVWGVATVRKFHPQLNAGK
jgi:hypothetical protein